MSTHDPQPGPFIASSRRSEVVSKLSARAAETPPAAHAQGIAASPARLPIQKRLKEVAKDFEEKFKDGKENKEHKEAKENKEHKESKETKEHKETKENKEHKESKESKEHKEGKEHKEVAKEVAKDHKETKEAKEDKEHKDSSKESGKDDKDGKEKDFEKEDKEDKEGKEDKDGKEDDDKFSNLEKQGDKDDKEDDDGKLAIEDDTRKPESAAGSAAHRRKPARSGLRPSELLARLPVV